MSDKNKTSVSSISDIARLAGVSASTVSRALAGSKMIGAGTRARINDLAREHGFQLNQMARNLRLKRTNSIGIVFPQDREVGQLVSDPFFITIFGHVADAVTARGYDLLLTRVIPTDQAWLDALANSGRIDGLIVIGQADQQDVLAKAAASYSQLVVWGEFTRGQGYCSVGTDNVLGGTKATRHLLDAGRRRILFAGQADVPEIKARYDGFLQAHRAAQVQPAGVLPVPPTPEGAFELFAAHLDGNGAPDGIVAASDVIAMAAIRALADKGLSVPGDVSVIGYDDVPLASQFSPALSTIRQDVRRGASEMVDRLFRRIGGEPCDPIVMAPELILRASA